jgi:hypothetical protein
MLTHDWPTLDILRLRYIARVLERAGGNKTRAADMLGIDRRTLNRILARERARQAAAARGYRPVGVPARPVAAPQPVAQAPQPMAVATRG